MSEEDLSIEFSDINMDEMKQELPTTLPQTPQQTNLDSKNPFTLVDDQGASDLGLLIMEDQNEHHEETKCRSDLDDYDFIKVESHQLADLS